MSPDALGPAGSDGGWQSVLWSRFMLPSRPRAWQGSLGLRSPVPKAARFFTVQETDLVSLGVPAAQGTRRPRPLSSPFLCRRPPCFLKAVGGDFLGPGGLFSAICAEPQDKQRPWLSRLPGGGRAGSLCLKCPAGLGQLMSSFLILCYQTRKTFSKTVYRFCSCCRCVDISSSFKRRWWETHHAPRLEAAAF